MRGGWPPSNRRVWQGSCPGKAQGTRIATPVVTAVSIPTASTNAGPAICRVTKQALRNRSLQIQLASAPYLRNSSRIARITFLTSVGSGCRCSRPGAARYGDGFTARGGSRRLRPLPCRTPKATQDDGQHKVRRRLPMADRVKRSRENLERGSGSHHLPG